jgi:hypothetical protein
MGTLEKAEQSYDINDINDRIPPGPPPQARLGQPVGKGADPF